MDSQCSDFILFMRKNNLRQKDVAAYLEVTPQFGCEWPRHVMCRGCLLVIRRSELPMS